MDEGRIAHARILRRADWVRHLPFLSAPVKFAANIFHPSFFNDMRAATMISLAVYASINI